MQWMKSAAMMWPVSGSFWKMTRFLFVHYTDGIWRIDVEQEGSMPYEHHVCAGTDEDDYSDVFLTESDVTNHEIAYK